VAAVAIVYPKKARRLLVILLFLNFRAVVTTAINSQNVYLRAMTAASLAGTLTLICWPETLMLSLPHLSSPEENLPKP
jgi:hypothetical protein